MVLKTDYLFRLVVFLTRRMSIKEWDKVGLLDREMAIYRRMKAAGIDVGIVSYGNRDDLDYVSRIGGIQIHCNKWNLPRAIYETFIPTIHQAFLQTCDVVKTNQTNGARVALSAARRYGKPFVSRCGYMWSEFEALQKGEQSGAARRALETEQEVFSAADRVVVTTDAMADDIRSRLPNTSDRVNVIPNYVDTDSFFPIEEAEKEFDLVFVGRLADQKNVDGLLEAIRPLKVSLKLIGDGDLDEWKARYSDLGDRLRWEGAIPHVQLPKHLNSGSIFVLPSHYEGHPKTLIEAMACGLPVLGGDSPGINNLIVHGENGYLCETSPDSIRSAVENLSGDVELRRRLGEGARQLALKQFGLDSIVKREIDLLQGVAGGEL